MRPDGAIVVSGANTYVLNSTSGSQIQMWTTSALLAIFGDSSMLLYFQSYGQFYIYKLNPSGRTAVYGSNKIGSVPWTYQAQNYGNISGASIDGDDYVYISFLGTPYALPNVLALDAHSGGN